MERKSKGHHFHSWKGIHKIKLNCDDYDVKLMLFMSVVSVISVISNKYTTLNASVVCDGLDFLICKYLKFHSAEPSFWEDWQNEHSWGFTIHAYYASKCVEAFSNFFFAKFTPAHRDYAGFIFIRFSVSIKTGCVDKYVALYTVHHVPGTIHVFNCSYTSYHHSSEIFSIIFKYSFEPN